MRTAEAEPPGAETPPAGDRPADRRASFDVPSWFSRSVVPYIALIVVVVYFSATATGFLTVSNLLIIAQQVAILMVIALGATLVVVAGSIDLSVGAIATLVGVLAAYVSSEGHPSLVWVLVLIGLLCGVLNGVLVAYAKLPSFIVTLGTLFIFGGIASKISNGFQIPLSYDALDKAVNGTAIGQIPNSAFWALAAIIVTTVLAYRTTFGRRVYAIGGNEMVARLSGLAVERTKVAMYAYSGLLAGFAGLMLTARGGGSSPAMGDAFLLNSIAAIVMGGTSLTGGAGGPARTILGVVTIGVLSNGMVLSGINPYYQTIVFGVVVIGAVALSVRRSELAAVK